MAQDVRARLGGSPRYNDPMKRKRKRRKKAVVAPLGPPTNLRPAGAHRDKKKYNRRRSKAEVVDEAAEQE